MHEEALAQCTGLPQGDGHVLCVQQEAGRFEAQLHKLRETWRETQFRSWVASRPGCNTPSGWGVSCVGWCRRLEVMLRRCWWGGCGPLPLRMCLCGRRVALLWHDGGAGSGACALGVGRLRSFGCCPVLTRSLRPGWAGMGGCPRLSARPCSVRRGGFGGRRSVAVLASPFEEVGLQTRSLRRTRPQAASTLRTSCLRAACFVPSNPVTGWGTSPSSRRGAT